MKTPPPSHSVNVNGKVLGGGFQALALVRQVPGHGVVTSTRSRKEEKRVCVLEAVQSLDVKHAFTTPLLCVPPQNLSSVAMIDLERDFRSYCLL